MDLPEVFMLHEMWVGIVSAVCEESNLIHRSEEVVISVIDCLWKLVVTCLI